MTDDLAGLHVNDLQRAIGERLSLHGATRTYDELQPFFDDAHPRSWDFTYASLYALFRDFAWSNADARLVAKHGFIDADVRWIELAVKTELAIAARQKGKKRGALTNQDRVERGLRSMLQDLLAAASKPAVKAAREKLKAKTA